MLGLRTVCYSVGNMDEALSWYQRAFGIEPYFNEPYYMGFNVGGFELGLIPRESTINGNNLLCYWGVDDIEKEYQHLLSIGAKVHEVPHSVGEPLIVCSVYDPWGNIIGLIYNPLFKQST